MPINILAAQGHHAIVRPTWVVHETTLRLLEIPPLRDQDDNVGFYWGACGVGSSQNWFATLSRSENGGASYSVIDDSGVPATVGTVTEALPAAASTARWDRANTISATLTAGSLVSVPPNDVLSGSNIALIGSEIVGFCNARLDVDGVTWVLSTLLRGIQGTPTDGHTDTDQFTLLDGAMRDQGNLARGLSVEWLYQCTNITETQSLTLNGARVRPLPVAHAGIEIAGSGDATISWVPRRRVGYQWFDGLTAEEIAVDEPVEAYEIDIIDGSAVARTITSFSTDSATQLRSAVYTAAQQATDGVSAPITAVIHQMSPRIGRGSPCTVTSA